MFALMAQIAVGRWARSCLDGYGLAYLISGDCFVSDYYNEKCDEGKIHGWREEPSIQNCRNHCNALQSEWLGWKQVGLCACFVGDCAKRSPADDYYIFSMTEEHSPGAMCGVSDCPPCDGGITERCTCGGIVYEDGACNNGVYYDWACDEIKLIDVTFVNDPSRQHQKYNEDLNAVLEVTAENCWNAGNGDPVKTFMAAEETYSKDSQDCVSIENFSDTMFGSSKTDSWSETNTNKISVGIGPIKTLFNAGYEHTWETSKGGEETTYSETSSGSSDATEFCTTSTTSWAVEQQVEVEAGDVGLINTQQMFRRAREDQLPYEAYLQCLDESGNELQKERVQGTLESVHFERIQARSLPQQSCANVCDEFGGNCPVEYCNPTANGCENLDFECMDFSGTYKHANHVLFIEQRERKCSGDAYEMQPGSGYAKDQHVWSYTASGYVATVGDFKAYYSATPKLHNNRAYGIKMKADGDISWSLFLEYEYLHCHDGKKNGDEEGTDCGGSCSEACAQDCVCADWVDSDGDGGADCTSNLKGGIPYCYTQPGVCTDGRMWSHSTTHEYSKLACSGGCCSGLTAFCLSCQLNVSVQDYCNVSPSTNGCECIPGNEDWHCCSSSHPCQDGFGDCDKDSDCVSGSCLDDVGLVFGATSGSFDVCGR